MNMLAEMDLLAWIALAVATAAIVYLLAKSKMRRKREPLADPMPKFTLSRQRALERDMQNLIVELSNMARQITGQLDTRAAKLEMLIQEANQKIATLQRANDAQRSPLTPFEMEDDSQPAAPTVAESAPPEPPSPWPADPLPPPTPTHDPVQQRHQRIYELADQGLTPQQIAGELNRPAGEIELILALRN